jgi:signal peptidase I
MDFSGLYQVDRRKKKGKITIFLKNYFLPFFIIFLAAFFLQLLLRALLLYPVKIKTDSMEPSLKQGDRVFFIYPHLTTIIKGSLIHAQHKGQNGIELFCKVVGIEGDVAQILNKSLFINHALVKNYESLSKDKTVFSDKLSYRDNTGEFLIGPRQYFCLNDNWENTQDSRTLGAISFDEIKGKVIFLNFAGFGYSR